MKLTRRGWLVVGTILLAIIMAAEWGARGLNAVAVPGIVVLLAGGYHLRRIDAPSLTRELPDRATRGETVRVRLHFEVDRSLSAQIQDTIGDGLVATGNNKLVTLTNDPIEYDLRLQSRGRRQVGPTEAVVTDVLGLLRRSFEFPMVSRVLVLPRIHPLAWAGRQELIALFGGASDERREFDHLRHYKRGDPVRDIHWKSSAKQPSDDLIVKRFADDQDSRSVMVAGMGDEDRGDEMAESVASITIALLETGVAVGVATPSGTIDPDTGVAHRERIIDHLALCETGRVTDRVHEQADILVNATADGIEVDFGNRQRSFAELSGRQLAAGGPKAVA